MSRKPVAGDFVGKIIKSVECEATNYIRFHFTDGTSVALEVECVLPTLGLHGLRVVT